MWARFGNKLGANAAKIALVSTKLRVVRQGSGSVRRSWPEVRRVVVEGAPFGLSRLRSTKVDWVSFGQIRVDSVVLSSVRPSISAAFRGRWANYGAAEIGSVRPFRQSWDPISKCRLLSATVGSGSAESWLVTAHFRPRSTEIGYFGQSRLVRPRSAWVRPDGSTNFSALTGQSLAPFCVFSTRVGKHEQAPTPLP